MRVNRVSLFYLINIKSWLSYASEASIALIHPKKLL